MRNNPIAKLIAAIIVFPGSNREQDAAMALRRAGFQVEFAWHADALPAADFYLLPGGFSYGDYLRPGAIAARSPALQGVAEQAERGVPVFGVCNGFQILLEAQLLPGALMRNAGQRFICREISLRTETAATRFTAKFEQGGEWRCPIAHHDGNYFAPPGTIKQLQEANRIVFRYAGTNPNGSADGVAGIINDRGNVLGMMPHPENSEAGLAIFESVLESLSG